MWAEKYVGLPYEDYNCAELIRHVLKSEFNHDLQLPIMPKTLVGMHKMINEEKNKYPISEKPKDSDIVIMNQNGKMSHIGLLYMKGNQSYVLHAVQTTRSTILTNSRLLYRMAMRVLEYRTWR